MLFDRGDGQSKRRHRGMDEEETVCYRTVHYRVFDSNVYSLATFFDEAFRYTVNDVN